MTDLMVIEQQGVRVLTTAQLAECYGTDTNTVKVNFNRNKERYEEGKHYICLKGEELQAFKNDVTNCNLVGSRASTLYLWTERGALLHAKSLNTDKAWEVYDQLVETYFRAKKAETALNELSPQLQLMIRFETEQKAMRQDIDDNTNRLDAIEKKLKADPKATQRIKVKPKPWSEREKDYLRKAVALGQTDVEIAADMKRTVYSIQKKRSTLGLIPDELRFKHWTKAEDRKLLKLVDKGLSGSEIGQIVGRSTSGVYSRLKKLRAKK